MAIMENVVRVGKTYKVRKRIQPECRIEFGVTGEFKAVSPGHYSRVSRGRVHGR